MPSETLQQLCERSAKRRGREEEIDRIIAKSGNTIERAFQIGCVGDFVTTQELAETKLQVLKLIMYLTQIAAALEYKHATRIETGQ